MFLQCTRNNLSSRRYKPSSPPSLRLSKVLPVPATSASKDWQSDLPTNRLSYQRRPENGSRGVHPIKSNGNRSKRRQTGPDARDIRHALLPVSDEFTRDFSGKNTTRVSHDDRSLGSVSGTRCLRQSGSDENVACQNSPQAFAYCRYGLMTENHPFGQTRIVTQCHSQTASKCCRRTMMHFFPTRSVRCKCRTNEPNGAGRAHDDPRVHNQVQDKDRQNPSATRRTICQAFTLG